MHAITTPVTPFATTPVTPSVPWCLLERVIDPETDYPVLRVKRTGHVDPVDLPDFLFAVRGGRDPR